MTPPLRLLVPPLFLAAVAFAGDPSPTTRADAALLVEGTIRQTFRSIDPDLPEALVELAVERVEVRGRLPSTATHTIPVPEDVVFVRSPPGAAGAPADLPRRGARVRAHLLPRAAGGWQTVASGGWEVLVAPPEAGPRDLRPDRPKPPALGLSVERLDVRGRPALRVTAVAPESPAARAGLEVGDVIVAAAGAEVAGLADLEALARHGVPFPLTVLDVRTGKPVDIRVEPPAAIPSPVPAEPPPPGPAATKRLGVSVEVVDAGGRPALRAVTVAGDGPASRAGIEVGDVLVAADGVPLTSQEALKAALATSGPGMTITVRDVRTGRDTPVQVAFEASTPGKVPAPETPPAPRTPGDAGGTRIERLGILGDVGLHDVEAAVLVVEVLPGGAAARAGVRRGAVIFQADGKKVLSPKALDDVVRAAGRSIRLGVEDPQRGAIILEVVLD